MPRIITLLFFILFSYFASAQNSFTIKGSVKSKEANIPLEAATVYVTSVKDSSVIDYSITERNGNFSITVRKQTQPFKLKISTLGYQNYEKEYPNLTANLNVGEVLIEDAVTTLGEVVIKSEAPPVRIKNDTLEFNASSFKVNPDSNVEALLKQLPGVEVSKDGKITVNGKEVNEILVNGKSFFGKDGAVAIKNLPSEIIDKIQVSDTKTKEEQLTGQGASSDKKSINITIQEDKNKGLFGKFTGGYGSDERYEASGLINYFKDKQKISFLGASNNINAVGFSMDEIFDAMGGGRNRSFYSNSDGSFGIDDMSFGGGSGITQSSMVGVNFADEFFKGKFDPNGSYFFTNSKNENNRRSRIENLLPADPITGESNSFITESSGNSETHNDGHNLTLELQYKIDPKTTLSLNPKLSKNNSLAEENSESSSSNNLGLINRSNSYKEDDRNSTNFSNSLYLMRAFKKKGRSLGITFNNNNKENDASVINKSETYFFQDPDMPDDIRNQREFNNVKENSYYARVGYLEPLVDSLSLNLRIAHEWKDYSKNKATFNYDSGSQRYSDANSLLSYDLESRTKIFNPTVGINVRKNKYSGGVYLGTQVIDFENTSLYEGQTGNVSKKYMYPTANGWFNYRLSKSKSIYSYYNFEVRLPNAGQILPIVDLSNPLSQIIGNPNLEPGKSHNLYMNYNNYDYATKSGYYVYGGANFVESEIVASRFFDPTDLISRTTYQNIDNMVYSYAGINWNKSIKKEENTFRLGLGFSGNFNVSKGITNNAEYRSEAFSFEPAVNLGWDYGELLTIEPSYSYNWNLSNFSNYTIDKTSYFTHNFKIQTTSRWPKHVVFGNDFGYTYNSNISDGFKKDFFLLNTSLGYNFMADKMLFKVKVYDLLNQNQSAVRTITPTAIQDIENTVLKRYVMFSLTYQIEKFGGKKKEEF